MADVVLVADCGATNISVSAVDAGGKLVATAGVPNGPVQQEDADDGWLVWDFDGLWQAVCTCCREVIGQVGAETVRAVTVTTWGADGAPVDREGRLTYPPIAWECSRTADVARRVAEQIGPRRLFNITGYQAIRFNTLFKLAWLRENVPESLEEAHKWLMMPGLLSHRLSGRMSMDVTAASTMMLLDLEAGTWSADLLDAVDLDATFFPDVIHPGEVIGGLSDEAAGETGLSTGIPVVAAGHDTQFAPIGSGATPEEAVLSTGTWEIAMLRTPGPVTGDFAFEEGILTEVDAVRGLYDPQLLMMGSGVLEWVRENLYADVADRREAYATMIAEAGDLEPGAGGVMMAPSFVPDTGPARKYATAGTVLGLGLTTGRAHVYRAALEGLCFQLREALRILCRATGFEPERLRVVGGGSRNELWNRLRADVCCLPVVVIEDVEATTVGAAVAAWVGLGRFESLEEGERHLSIESHVIEPSEDTPAYEQLYHRYRRIGPSLADFYGS